LHKFGGVIRIALPRRGLFYSTISIFALFSWMPSVAFILFGWSVPFLHLRVHTLRSMTWLGFGGAYVDIWLGNGWRSWFLFSFFRSQIPLGYDENEVDGLLQSQAFYCILNGLRELELLDARKERVMDEIC
jgi:hypothetical protein